MGPHVLAGVCLLLLAMAWGHLAVASSPLLWGSSRSCTMSTWPGSGPGCGSGLRSNWARARALDKPKPSPPPIKAFAAAWGVASSWVPRGDHVPILLSVPLAPGSGHRLEGHSVAASPARMDLKVVAVSFLLLVLCSEAAGYQLLTWEQANTAVKGVLDKVHSTGVEKLRDIYDKSVDAVGTYTSILTDQLYHWWCGEQ
ncbi:uncharacterized protein LOC102569738 isoform X2 [Alligator mississippiensis]|uniref:uncharacterized protein LOC102569738 isoform X2 n=1 Tax=Alligator mississippiensis TaxID=8496 RepID=UPI0028775862|nr:uncharacterized protein LOC102569738 isoform X2 [Alligator mississippiensis]